MATMVTVVAVAGVVAGCVAAPAEPPKPGPPVAGVSPAAAPASGSRAIAPPGRAASAAVVPEALHIAAVQGDAAAVRRLLAGGADPDRLDAYGSTPLIAAITFGHEAAARALIAGGADLSRPNAEGSTPLHVAAFFAREGIVQALLDAGANRYALNDAGDTPRDALFVPFERLRPVYDAVARGLGPLGLQLDLARIEAARPALAERLEPPARDLAAVRYTPAAGRWPVARPQDLGLDPRRLAAMYVHAPALPTLYGLLVVKDGRLVAERYFHEGSPTQLSARMSATKSVTSALVGLALQRGCLKSLDQPMLDFFPDQAPRVQDPRKRRITLRQLLQMRGGYPWEGRTPPVFERLFMSGQWHWLPHLVDIPLAADPGTVFAYSNLSSHLLGVAVARACGVALPRFAQDQLFGPIGATLGGWPGDADGYAWGWGEIRLTARDMARFGQLYLDGGRQVLAADWVADSLQRYTEGIGISGPPGTSEAGRYLHDLGYGYQWWSARAGAHRMDFAWGHGGQLVVLLRELGMVIVTTADPLHRLPESLGWKYEVTVLNLVGRYVASLPGR
jgi:CubicO group peptidase (beta-lactamase class C family)